MKTTGIVGALVLVVVCVVGWQRERQRATKLAEECQRLSHELAFIRAERSNSDGENITPILPDARPEDSENNASNQPERLGGNMISNPVAVIAVTEANALSNQDSEPVAIISKPPALSSTNNEPPYTDLQLEIYRCSNQMGAINFAAEHWAADHGGLIPENLMELRGYLSPMILVCPAVRPKNLSSAWERFQPEDVTYQVLSGSKGKFWDLDIPGPSPVTVGWLRCPVHNLRVLNRKMSAGIPSSQVFQPR